MTQKKKFFLENFQIERLPVVFEIPFTTMGFLFLICMTCYLGIYISFLRNNKVFLCM